MKNFEKTVIAGALFWGLFSTAKADERWVELKGYPGKDKQMTSENADRFRLTVNSQLSAGIQLNGNHELVRNVRLDFGETVVDLVCSVKFQLPEGVSSQDLLTVNRSEANALTLRSISDVRPSNMKEYQDLFRAKAFRFYNVDAPWDILTLNFEDPKGSLQSLACVSRGYSGRLRNPELLQKVMSEVLDHTVKIERKGIVSKEVEVDSRKQQGLKPGEASEEVSSSAEHLS